MEFRSVLSAGVLAIVLALSCNFCLVQAQRQFLEQLENINDEIVRWNKDESFRLMHASGEGNEAILQSLFSKWPTQVMAALQVFTGSSYDDKIDLTKVARMISGLRANNLSTQQEFLANIGKYLSGEFDYMPDYSEDPDEDSDYGSDYDYDDSDSSSDSDSEERPPSDPTKYKAAAWNKFITQMQDRMCGALLPQGNGYLKFHEWFKKLRVLKDEENVDDKKFIELVLDTDQPIAAVYPASIICQIFDSMVGASDWDTDHLQLELPMITNESDIAQWPYPEIAPKKQQRFFDRIQQINLEAEKWYKNEFTLVCRVKTCFGTESDAHQQSRRFHWPRQMMKVLQVASGKYSSSPVNLRMAARMASGLKEDDFSTRQQLLENFGYYLVNKQSLDTQKTEMKGEFFAKQKQSLCAPFLSGSKGYYDFSAAINDLLVLKKLLGVSDQQFIDSVLSTYQPIAPLYTAAMICKVIEDVEDVLSEGGKYTLELPVRQQNEISSWPYPTDLLKY